MRLIHTHNLDLADFIGDQSPPYAILSHTWGKEEVTYAEWKQPNAETKQKKGYTKIVKACFKARQLGCFWLWVDTNCIDKTSSSELSEAINSMFRWYRDSKLCLAYLSDVDAHNMNDHLLPLSEQQQQFYESKWFIRGWTLQELIAPKKVLFYSKNWTFITSLKDTVDVVSRVTGIPRSVLNHRKPLKNFSVAQRVSWVSRRFTTRIEDMAYCLLGILDIQMPLLYGEGSKAFGRLQEEVIRLSDDHSILTCKGDAWLAPLPGNFYGCSDIERTPPILPILDHYSMTNAGIRITLPVLQIAAEGFLLVLLNCRPSGSAPGTFLGLMVMGDDASGYSKAPASDQPIAVSIPLEKGMVPQKTMYLSRGISNSHRQPTHIPEIAGKRAVVAYDGDQWRASWVKPTHPFQQWIPDSGRDCTYGSVLLQDTEMPGKHCAVIALCPTRAHVSPTFVLIGCQPSIDDIWCDWFSAVLDEPPRLKDTYLSLMERFGSRRENRGSSARIMFPAWSTGESSPLSGVPLIPVPSNLYAESNEVI